MSKLLLETLTASQKCVDNYNLTALETLVFRTVHKVVSSPEFITRLFDSVNDNSGFIVAVAVIVKADQGKTVTKKSQYCE